MSKRKPPKNLRPYATPSGKKTPYVQLTDPKEIADFSKTYAELDHPHAINDGHGGLWVIATDLRKWRASQTTSEGGDAK